MSARVDAIYQWYCPDCSAGDGPYDYSGEATAAADEHDRLNHAPDETQEG